MSQSLTERYDARIAGMLSCYDRLVITGTLPVACYAGGMTGYLDANGIRIFDYPDFAKTLRDRVRERAASLAAEAGVTIEHIAKPHVRKEDVVARVLEQRGDHPGLVHVISAMEACDGTSPGTTSRRTRPTSDQTAPDYQAHPLPGHHSVEGGKGRAAVMTGNEVRWPAKLRDTISLFVVAHTAPVAPVLG